MQQEVEQVLNKVRPALEADGGGIELVEVTEDGLVRVRLTGACGGCPMSQMTLSQLVERALKEELDGVTGVEAVL